MTFAMLRSGFGDLDVSGFLNALHSKSESSFVIEGRYLSRHLNNRIAHRCQTVGSVCLAQARISSSGGGFHLRQRLKRQRNRWGRYCE